MTAEATTALPDRHRFVAPTPADESGVTAHLLCRIGNQIHAIPIAQVVEIMRVLPLEPIAGAPPYVRGLCIIRGMPVPVVDPGLLIGNRQTPPGRLVAVKAGERIVALQVEAIVGIRAFADAAFNELPPLLHDVAAETIAAVGTLDAELLLSLRTARVVPAAVFADLDRRGTQP